MITRSLIKEFVNQADLQKSDGSDAGKTDVSNKAPSNDVKFSLMRNTINSDGKVSGSDVANYLEKATDINDEVDTVLYGLETDDGEVVKVYVNASQADAFEAEMKKMLGMEDDIEAAINELATKFDIVDVIWPKGQGPDAGADEEGEGDDDDLDLDATADIGDPGNDQEAVTDEPPADDDSDMEVIASVDDEQAGKKKKPVTDEEPSDEEGKDGKKAKKPDDKHSKLKGVGKNMKVKEGKLQVGWYVTDGDDKTVAGPVEEAEAKRICKEKGGDAKGFVVSYISDYDARRANETQGDTMSIGNKFLQRVLAEERIDEISARGRKDQIYAARAAQSGKEDRDGVMDGFNIPMDAQQRAMAAKMKWKLPKQIIALFSLIGIPGVKLNSDDAVERVQDAAEMLRTQLSVRRAFLEFYKAYAEAKGHAIDKEAEPVTEARMKRGNYLQKQLETVLVKLGLPEALISTTGPGVVGTALFRASKDIEDNADLKALLRMLAIRMGIKPADAMAPLEDEPVTEANTMGTVAPVAAKGPAPTEVETATVRLLAALGINASTLPATVSRKMKQVQMGDKNAGPTIAAMMDKLSSKLGLRGRELQ